MRNFLFSALAVLLLTAVSGCFDGTNIICPKPKGPLVVETLVMAPFTKIRLSCDAKVYISQGAVAQVVVEGASNMIDFLKTDVHDGTWLIGLSECVAGSTDLSIYIIMPTIERIDNASSGDIVGETVWEANKLEINSQGSGNIWANVRTDELFSILNGSGDMEIQGIANKHLLYLTGSGNAIDFGLTSKNATVSLSGSGSAKVFVSETLEVGISGSGNAYYKGNPAISKVVSGSGRVINAN